LLAAVGSLPARLRAVVELVDLDGLTVTEAAAALGIRPATARVRLHRARQQLKNIPVPDQHRLLATRGT
jgi:RNA polymerase sigma factor (sigma-70 family)